MRGTGLFGAALVALLTLSGTRAVAGAQMEVVVENADLPTTKPNGSPWDLDGSLPDPYIVVRVNDQPICKTSVKPNTARPEWHAVCRFEGSHHDDVVSVELYDADFDWGDLSAQLSFGPFEGLGMSVNWDRIPNLLSRDKKIASNTLRLKESSYANETTFSIWLVKEKRQGIFLKIRPAS